MQIIRLPLLLLITFSVMFSCQNRNAENPTFKPYPVSKTDDEWKEVLTQKEYYILRKKGTEQAFSGAYWNTHEAGRYHCAACQQVLFTSDTKFDSGTGWPSFYKPCSDSSVTVFADNSLGMMREEVVCSRCGGHLGHLFDDGPEPTGLRYCLNSRSLKFEKAITADSGKVLTPGF